MKRWLSFLSVLVIISTFLTSCASTLDALKVGETKTAYIGDEIYWHTQCGGPLNCVKYKLTLTGITPTSVLVNYDEYFYQIGNGVQVAGAGGWYLKPGFSKKLQYPRRGYITFRGIRLKILRTTSDSITYTKVK